MHPSGKLHARCNLHGWRRGLLRGHRDARGEGAARGFGWLRWLPRGDEPGRGHECDDQAGWAAWDRPLRLRHVSAFHPHDTRHEWSG
jgi:hypothetical protein